MGAAMPPAKHEEASLETPVACPLGRSPLLSRMPWSNADNRRYVKLARGVSRKDLLPGPFQCQAAGSPRRLIGSIMVQLSPATPG